MGDAFPRGLSRMMEEMFDGREEPEPQAPERSFVPALVSFRDSSSLVMRSFI